MADEQQNVTTAAGTDNTTPPASGVTEATQDTTTTPVQTEVSDEGITPFWRDALPEDLRGHDRLKGYDNPEALVRDFLKPKAPEAYAPVEGLHKDDPLVKDFYAAAKTSDLSQEQANAVLDVYRKRVQAEIQRREKSYDEGKAELAKEWGEGMASKLEAANKAISTFCHPALVEKLKKSGFDNDPDAVRFFAKLGEAISEGSVATGPTSRSNGIERTPGGSPMFSFNTMEK